MSMWLVGNRDLRTPLNPEPELYLPELPELETLVHLVCDTDCG